MIRIELGNCYAQICDPLTDDALSKVDHTCSYFVKGAQFSEAYQAGRWDGRKHLFSAQTRVFPSGLISRVLEVLPTAKVYDQRLPPAKRFDDLVWSFEHPLRDYQQSIVEQAVSAQRGTIQCPTGSGKTVIAMRLAYELGMRTLFVVNTKEAFMDTVAMANRCFVNERIGRMGSGHRVWGGFLTIATMSTLISKTKGQYENLRQAKQMNFDAVIVDEVHHVGADTWYKAVMGLDVFYRYGLTGTAFRTDGGSLLLQATSGKLIGQVTTNELQEQGHLAKSIVRFIRQREPKELDVPIRYPEAYNFGIVKNEFRNRVIQQIVSREATFGKSILVIVEKIEHGEILKMMLDKVVRGVVFISGGSSEREELKRKFASGEIKVVIATRIYNESADIPILQVVINAAGGKSGISVIQRIGRALRIHEDKDKAVIYDFMDMFNMKLELHAAERFRWIKKEGHDTVFYDSVLDINEDDEEAAFGKEKEAAV